MWAKVYSGGFEVAYSAPSDSAGVAQAASHRGGATVLVGAKLARAIAAH